MYKEEKEKQDRKKKGKKTTSWKGRCEKEKNWYKKTKTVDDAASAPSIPRGISKKK